MLPAPRRQVCEKPVRPWQRLLSAALTLNYLPFTPFPLGRGPTSGGGPQVLGWRFTSAGKE